METRYPLIQITGRSLFSFLALLFVLLLLWLSTGYPPRARYVPQLVAYFTIICLLLQVILDSSPRLSALYGSVERAELFKSEPAGENQSGDGPPDLRQEITAYLWLAGLLAGLVLFGFLISIPCYILFYLRTQARLPWLNATLYGIGTFLFTYLLFVTLFEIRLYPGFLLETLLDF